MKEMIFNGRRYRAKIYPYYNNWSVNSIWYRGEIQLLDEKKNKWFNIFIYENSYKGDLIEGLKLHWRAYKQDKISREKSKELKKTSTEYINLERLWL